VKAVLIGQILIRKGRIWTEKPRIDHVVIFQASAPRIFNVAALIALVEAAGLVAIASAAADSGVIASAVEDSVAVALADSAAADSEADGKN
jgi:hypothetical protein